MGYSAGHAATVEKERVKMYNWHVHWEWNSEILTDAALRAY